MNDETISDLKMSAKKYVKDMYNYDKREQEAAMEHLVDVFFLYIDEVIQQYEAKRKEST